MDNPRQVIQPIRQLSKEESENIKAPEKRLYLICLCYTDESTSWITVIGRTNAYDACITAIKAGDVNLEDSIVLAENTKLGSHASLYQFMKHMENFFAPDTFGETFDVEDYVVGDSEDEYAYNNTDVDIHAPINVTNGSLEGEDV